MTSSVMKRYDISLKGGLDIKENWTWLAASLGKVLTWMQNNKVTATLFFLRGYDNSQIIKKYICGNSWPPTLWKVMTFKQYDI